MKLIDRALFGVFLLSVIVALFVMSGRAEAQSSRTAAAQIPPPDFGFPFRWTDPVEREDGEEFDPVTEIASYRLTCTSQRENAEIVINRGDTLPADDGQRRYHWLSAVSTGGWYSCRMTVIDLGGLESAESESIEVRRRAVPNSVLELQEEVGEA